MRLRSLKILISSTKGISMKKESLSKFFQLVVYVVIICFILPYHLQAAEIDKILTSADVLLSNGDINGAIKIYNVVLKKKITVKMKAHAHKNRGLAYMQSNNFKQAVADFSEACKMGEQQGCSRLDQLTGYGDNNNKSTNRNISDARVLSAVEKILIDARNDRCYGIGSDGDYYFAYPYLADPLKIFGNQEDPFLKIYDINITKDEDYTAANIIYQSESKLRNMPMYFDDQGSDKTKIRIISELKSEESNYTHTPSNRSKTIVERINAEKFKTNIDSSIVKYDTECFKVTDGTVIDTHTQLEWPRNCNIKMRLLTLPRADDYIKWLNKVNYAGHNDWRMPTRKELLQLAGYNKEAEWDEENNINLKKIGFYNISYSKYLSSDTRQIPGALSDLVYAIDIQNGLEDDRYIANQTGGWILPVRDSNKYLVGAVPTINKKISDPVFTDKKSGLMWARNTTMSGDELDWHGAIRWVKTLHYAGFSDWRLPTKDELETFINQCDNDLPQYSSDGVVTATTVRYNSTREHYSPRFFYDNKFNGVSQFNYYWTSSNVDENHIGARYVAVPNKTDYVWAFRFTLGFYKGWKFHKGFDGYYAWPVRTVKSGVASVQSLLQP